MATFYTGVDQQRYDAGEKFLPMNRFLANYTAPTTNVEEDQVTTSYGIPNTTAFINSRGGGGALQAGDINFDDFNRITTENYMRKQPTPFVDATYNQKIQDKFFGMPTWQQGVTGADAGEYLAAGQDIPLDLTGAGKMKQGWQNTKEGVAAMMGKLPSITGFLNKFGIQNFSSLPPLDQAFIKQSSGYRGPTVFGDNTSGLNKDPFGLNVESLFGNYAEAVRDDLTTLNEHFASKTLADDGAEWDEEQGMFVGPKADYWNQMNKMNISRWDFRNQQINKQKQNEKIYQERRADIARVQSKVDDREKLLNELASEKDVTNASGNVIASTVNPAVDKSYHGGSANPHTDTGWSGSKQGGSSYDRGDHGGKGHHWADGGRVGFSGGGYLPMGMWGDIGKAYEKYLEENKDSVGPLMSYKQFWNLYIDNLADGGRVGLNLGGLASIL